MINFPYFLVYLTFLFLIFLLRLPSSPSSPSFFSLSSLSSSSSFPTFSSSPSSSLSSTSSFPSFSNNSSSLKRLLSPSNVKTACKRASGNPYFQEKNKKDDVQSIYDMVLKSRGNENRLKKMLKSSKTPDSEQTKEYFISFLSVLIPIAVFAIFAIIGFCGYCCCYCSTGCPPKCCCRRNYNEKPITDREMRYCGTIAFLMTAGVLASGIAGIIYNETFTSGYNDTACSLATVANDLLYGANISKKSNGTVLDQLYFLGVLGALDKVDLILKKFDGSIDSISTTFKDTDWLEKDKTTINSKINNIYENNKGKTVITSDARSTHNSETFVPSYFQNLGPPSSDTTVTAAFSKEFSTTSNVIASALNSIKLAGLDLTSQSKSIMNSIMSGNSSLADLKKSAASFDQSIDNFTSSGSDTLKIIYYCIIAIFAFAIAFSTFGIASCFLASCCNMPNIRVFTHLSWCALSLYAIVVLVISIVLIPFGIILIESCDTLDDVFGSQNNFQSYEALISKDFSSKLQVCYFSDGDFNKLFDTSKAFEVINTLTNSFNNNPNIKLVGSEITPQVLSKIAKFTSFELPAYDGSSAFSSPLLAIDYLNKWSDYSVDKSYQKDQGGCSISQDNFVYDISKCKYTKIFDPKWSADQDFSKQICIDVSNLAGQTAARYSTAFALCNKIVDNEIGATLEEIYTKEVEQIAKHKTDVRNVFSSLSSDVQSYEKEFNLYQNKLISLNDKVRNNLKNGINEFLNAVSDNSTGLIAGLNCTFAKVATESFKSSTCYSFVPSIFILFIIFLISGGFALFSSLFLIIMALKIKKREQRRSEDENKKKEYEYVPPAQGGSNQKKLEEGESVQGEQVNYHTSMSESLEEFTPFTSLLRQKRKSSIKQYNDHDHITTEKGKRIELEENPYRYWICLFYVIFNISINVNYIATSPLAKDLKTVYDLSDLVASSGALLYLILYTPVTLPSNYILDKFGIRVGLTFGMIATLIGAWVKIFINSSFYFFLLGSLIGAIGQPFILNAPAKIVAYWFKSENRVKATTFLGVINPISLGVGFLIPGLVVVDIAKSTEDEYKSSLRDLFFYQSLILTILCIPSLLFFREKPPNPPSYSATVKKISFASTIRKLHKNKNFVCLTLFFGLANGSLSSFSVVISLLIHPFGFNSFDTSLFGGVLIVFGLVGSFVASVYVAKTGLYKFSLGICCLGFACSIMMIGFCLFSEETLIMFIPVMFLGFFGFPLVPLGYEMGCELCFPVGEAFSTGVLVSSGQMVATVATIVMELVITDQTKVTAIVCLLVFFILTLIGLIFLCLMKEDLVRNDFDAAEKLSIIEKDQYLALEKNTQDFCDKNDSNKNTEKEKQENGESSQK